MVLRRRRGADRGGGDTSDLRDQWKPREGSGMDGQRITGRVGRRLLWCTLAAMLALSPGMGSAQTSTDACSQTSNVPASNDCQNQTQYPVTYSLLQTQSWSYSCTGDHPYFSSLNSGIAWNDTCFTNTENVVGETGSNFDGDFTNWCNTDTLVVTLACFKAPCCD